MEKTIKKPVEEKPTVGKADRRINAILSVVLGAVSYTHLILHSKSKKRLIFAKHGCSIKP